MTFGIGRWLALTLKEFQQLRKNRRLVIQLVIPPTVGLIAFGYALNPEVKNLRMGVADYSLSPQSRDFVSYLTANEAFRVENRYASSRDAERAMLNLDLDLVVVIPGDFAESLRRRQPAEVQVLVDAVNANSATIASGYLAQATAAFARGEQRAPAVNASTLTLYNPGNVHAWFFVTGVMSTMLIINAALVSAALTVREKELGTIEQLLMSPAQTLEVLFAKTTPVLALMLVVLLLAMAIAMTVFGMPQRGSWALLLTGAALSAVAGIGIGITVATFCSNQQQAQLAAFFLMPPIVLISGAVSPLETMPALLRYLSLVDPLRYMARLVRGVVLKGAGLELLWPQLVPLAVISIVLYGISAWRFRGQLK